MANLNSLKTLALLLACAVTLLPAGALPVETVAVRHTEGLVHGFLVLRTLEGNILADGDLIQVAHGDRVNSHLVFRFKDGSVHNETAIFSQHQHFQLVSDHLIQKGPAFPHPMEVWIDAATGQFTVRYADADGKEKVLSEHLKLPLDVANGMVFALLQNFRPGASTTTVSMVAAMPKPRIVKLVMSSKGEEAFSLGVTKRKATHYVVKIEIGGAAGL